MYPPGGQIQTQQTRNRSKQNDWQIKAGVEITLTHKQDQQLATLCSLVIQQQQQQRRRRTFSANHGWQLNSSDIFDWSFEP